MDLSLKKSIKEEKSIKLTKNPTYRRLSKHIKKFSKTQINSETLHKIKQRKTKKFGLYKNYSNTTIIKNNTDLFKSLITNINDKDFDDNPINNCDKQNTTFSAKPKIKKKLLKEYNELQKMEKKYRKIKLTSQLYDSLDDNEESENESENDGTNFYLSTDSTFIFVYDIVLIFFTFYTLMFIPINLAKRKYFCEKEKTTSMIFNLLNEVIYIIDVLVSFVRSYYNYEYKIITNNKKIIENYLGNGFIIDFIEAFPSYTITRRICHKNYYGKYSLSISEIVVSILLIIKIIKIFKVLNNKKNRAIEVFYGTISNYYFIEKIVNIVIYFITIFSFIHSLICIHIFIGEQSYPNWMVLVHIENESLLDKYISSFYFIITTMTTVGYGDIICISSVERGFQIILLAIGTIIYSFIITTFGNYIGKQSSIKIKLDNKKNILEQIRITHPLMPFKLYYKIQNYLVKEAFKKQNNKKMEICTLVNSLPDKIRNDMLKIIYKDIITNFKIFKDCKNSDFIIKMLSCFIQTTYKKDIILIQEGKKIENVIYVKDGHLILEATIDLLEPLKSIKKYFNENFKDIDIGNKSKKNSIASDEDEKENKEEKMNESFLKRKLNNFMENNSKVVSNRSPIFEINNEKNESFQIGLNENSIDNEDNSIINQNKNNNQYLKILDIRKNEHFGDIYMYLDRPSPLTLKVKSKRAEIFLLKKKDAINISNIHHNIVNRIKTKSYKNVLSLRKKTIKVLTKYFNFNKHTKGKSIQEMSWFNERSKNISTTDRLNITNISSNQKALMNKSNLSLFTKNRNLIRNSCIIINRKNQINQFDEIDLKKTITNNVSVNENNHNLKLSINYSSQNLISLKNKNVNSSNNQKNDINNSMNDLSSNNYPNLFGISFDKKNSKDSNNENNSYISKKINNKSNIDELENTKKEDEIMIINNMNSTIDKNIRRKIKLRVKKEKIINLWKFQNEVMNSKYDNDKTNQLSNIDEYEQNLINNSENSKDLKFLIFNKLLEYLSSESEEETVESKRYNDTYIKIENNISFNIKSSYYNLNNLTKGKVIHNKRIKNDLKIMIKQYIKENKKKEYNTINITSKNLIRYTKSSRKINNNKNTFSHKYLQNKINDLDNISSISKSSHNTIKSINSKKIKNNENNNSISDKKYKTKIFSNRIKQTINNNTDIYINFKNEIIDNKYSKVNFEKNNILNKIVLSEILAKNKKNAKRVSKSSTNLIFKNKDEKLSNFGSSKSAKKGLKNEF